MSGAALSLAEAKAFLRVETQDEDALIAGMIRTSAALCEAFTGLVLVEREISEFVIADGAWRRLAGTPVASVLGAADETGMALGEGGWASSIAADGDGWVRVDPGPARARVTYRAGLGADWNAVPEPLRQGMARLVAHLHASRDAGDDRGPPAAVAALWRPWRRMRLG